MKYIVEVNAKYLVSIEAETALRAEHIVLELDGVWGALAFDRDMMKTDTFMGAVQGCEMISMAELKAMSAEYEAAYVQLAGAGDAHDAADGEVARIEEMLKLAKENRRIARENFESAKRETERVKNEIGVRED